MKTDHRGWVKRQSPQRASREFPARHGLAWNKKEDDDLIKVWSENPDENRMRNYAFMHERTEGALLGRLWGITAKTLTAGVLRKIILGEVPKDPELILEIKPGTRNTHVGMKDILRYRVLLNGFCVAQELAGGWHHFQEKEAMVIVNGLGAALGIGYTTVVLEAVKSVQYTEAKRWVTPLP